VQATTTGGTSSPYVAISYGGTIAASSTDGITWTQRSMPVSASWFYVTVNTNTGVYVAITVSNSTIAASSTDGITWTQRTLPATANWRCLTVNPTTGIFVAIDQSYGYAASSTNGITWTLRSIGNAQWYGVAVNSKTGVFVAVAEGSAVAASSTDGITWTTRSLPTSGSWRAVTVNPNTGVFVTIAYNSSILATSTDGITWTHRTMPVSATWNAATVNPTTGVFVVVSSGTTAASSTDGITWTQRTHPTGAISVSVNSVQGVFVSIGEGVSTVCATSTDGITWTQKTLPVSSYWIAVTAGGITQAVATTGVGLGISAPSYQLDMSTDGARKLTTTTWLTGSDKRIKKDIESANLQMCYDTFKSIDLKYFKWNFPVEIVPDDKHSLGFIAQDVKEIFPNAVSESNSYGYSDFLSLNTDQILKAMYGALKKTMSDVEELKIQIKSLGI